MVNLSDILKVIIAAVVVAIVNLQPSLSGVVRV